MEELIEEKTIKGAYKEIIPQVPLRKLTAEELSVLDSPRFLLGFQLQLARRGRVWAFHPHARVRHANNALRRLESLHVYRPVIAALVSNGTRCFTALVWLSLLTGAGAVQAHMFLLRAAGVVLAFVVPPREHNRSFVRPLLRSLLVCCHLACIVFTLVPSAAPPALMAARSSAAYAAVASTSDGGVHLPVHLPIHLPVHLSTACVVSWLALEASLLVLWSVPFSLVGLASGARLVDVRTARPPCLADKLLWWAAHHLYVTLLSPLLSAGVLINDSFDPLFRIVGGLMRGALLSRYPAMDQRLLVPAQTSTDSVAGVLVVNQRMWGDLRALAAAGFSPRIDLEDDAIYRI